MSDVILLRAVHHAMKSLMSVPPGLGLCHNPTKLLTQGFLGKHTRPVCRILLPALTMSVHCCSSWLFSMFSMTCQISRQQFRIHLGFIMRFLLIRTSLKKKTKTKHYCNHMHMELSFPPGDMHVVLAKRPHELRMLKKATKFTLACTSISFLKEKENNLKHVL